MSAMRGYYWPQLRALKNGPGATYSPWEMAEFLGTVQANMYFYFERESEMGAACGNGVDGRYVLSGIWFQLPNLYQSSKVPGSSHFQIIQLSISFGARRRPYVRNQILNSNKHLKAWVRDKSGCCADAGPPSATRRRDGSG